MRIVINQDRLNRAIEEIRAVREADERQERREQQEHNEQLLAVALMYHEIQARDAPSDESREWHKQVALMLSYCRVEGVGH